MSKVLKRILSCGVVGDVHFELGSHAHRHVAATAATTKMAVKST